MKDTTTYISTIIVGFGATIYNVLLSIFLGIPLALPFAILTLTFGSWIFLIFPGYGQILAILLSMGLMLSHLITLLKMFMFIDLAIVLTSMLIIFLHIMSFAVPEPELPKTARRLMILPPFFLLGMAGVIVLYMS